MRILKRILKWGGLTLFAVVFVMLGYSQYKISSGPDRVPYALQLPADVQSLAEGERLVRKLGCAGCHGENLAGRVMFDELVFARVVAPNVTTTVASQPLENIEAVLRQGIGFDGRPLVVMPSLGLSYLTDADTAKIVAYLRTLPEVQNDLPATYFGTIARLLLLTGEFETEPAKIRRKPRLRFDSGSAPRLAQGEYLAMTMCSECHGVDFDGKNEGGFVTPSLDIVAAYSSDSFARLLETGESVSGRSLGLMSDVTQVRTVHLDVDEVQALYAFLTDRIGRTADGMQ